MACSKTPKQLRLDAASFRTGVEVADPSVSLHVNIMRSEQATHPASVMNIQGVSAVEAFLSS